MDVALREMSPEDWPAVAEICVQGIESGHATFEREAPSWEAWDAGGLPTCRLIAEREGVVLGFACLSPTSKRAVYAGVCEVMVYVADGARGQGVGGRLIAALVTASEEEGIWTLEASIFPENLASVRAHRRVGFRVVGTRERVGRFFDGRWRDTVILERRSGSVGNG